MNIVTIQSIWHNSAADFFYVLENLHRKFANIVSPSTDAAAQCAKPHGKH